MIHSEIFPHLFAKLSFQTTEYIRFYDPLASLGRCKSWNIIFIRQGKESPGTQMFKNVNWESEIVCD